MPAYLLHFQRKAEKILIRRRWEITLFLVVLGLILEAYEHLYLNERFTSAFLLDIFLKAFALPLLLGTLLSLHNSKRKLSRVLSQFDIQRAARSQLANAQSWGELTSLLLQIPRTILPLAGDVLWILNPAKSRYEQIGTWSADGFAIEVSAPSPADKACPLYSPAVPSSNQARQLCSCNQNRELRLSYRILCLPLVLGRRPMGLLQLFTPVDQAVQPEHIHRLTEAATDMALALERFQLWSTIQGSTLNEKGEQDKVMRYLHDAIAPDLAYLRLKLDQFALEGKQTSPSISNLDLQHLTEIANQAYEKVRVSLSQMEPVTPVNLPKAVEDFVLDLSKRAQLEVEFHMEGNVVNLPPHFSRQILYMVREALRNVEKHARAEKVYVFLLWLNDGLKIEIVDDGRGFNVEEVAQRKYSYGLKILEDCAREINADFNFYSSPDSGTRLTIWLPLHHEG